MGLPAAHQVENLLTRFEQALVDPLAEPNLTHAYMQRMADFFVAWNERWLSASEGEFDIYRCGDEIGNNLTMHISPAVWREFYKPHLERVFAVAKKHGLKRLFLHAQSIAFPDTSGNDLHFTAPLADDLQRFLENGVPKIQGKR